MHYEIRTETTINATPQAVWKVLADLDSYSEWNPFIVSASGVVAVGQRLTNRIQPPGGKGMTFKPTVTEVAEGRTFEWLGRLGLPGVFDGRHRFELTQTPDGLTHLAHSEQFSGVLVRLLRKSLDTQTRQGFDAMNQALKRRVEIAQGCAV